MFITNKNVDKYNNQRIKTTEGKLYLHEADDKIVSRTMTEYEKKLKIASFQKQPRNNTQGLPFEIHLKIGIRYMMIKNINVIDGLVNGATGVLKFITRATKNI